MLYIEAYKTVDRAYLPKIPLKQVPRKRLVRHVFEHVAQAVGHYHVSAGFEGLQVVCDLGAEELRRVRRGHVDHHGHALCLHALHDALDGARAEVVGVGLLVVTLVCASGSLITATLSAGPYLTNNAYSPSLTS